MVIKRVGLGFALAFLALPALAGEGDTGGSDVSIITAADIAREKPSRLVDMLKSRVGLDERVGGVSMRGIEGVAVFVDGFASSMGELGSVKPEQVEKIEILRGAASARFGAEAMGGAIVVTTRKSAASPLKGSATLGSNSRGGAFARARASVGQGGWSATVLLESKYSRGYLMVPDSPFPYQITVTPDSSRSRQAEVKLGWSSDRLDATLHFKHEDAWVGLGRPNWYFEDHGQSLRLKALWRASEALHLEAALGMERTNSPGMRDQGTGTDAAGLAPAHELTENPQRKEGTLALIWQFEGWEGRLGGTLSRSTGGYSSTDVLTGMRQSSESTLRNQAWFVSATGPLGAGRLELEARQDTIRYASFRMENAGQVISGGGEAKAAFSPKAALSWPLPGLPDAGYRLRGSVGTGFSPPSAYYLYHRYESPGSITLPNPGLKPERSLTADVSLSRSTAAGQWEFTFFSTRWQDKIANRILDYGVPNIYQAQNVGQATAHGIEAQWSRKLGDFSLAANFTYSRTRVVRELADPALVGKELPDMPRHKANFSIAYEPDERFSARAKLRAVGSAFTDEVNTVTDARGYRWKKSAYAVFDFAATWRRPGWEFTLALDNAFDRDYLQGMFWHGEPRTLRGEFKFSF